MYGQRRLTTVSSTIQLDDFGGHYYKSSSVAANKIMSNKCSVINEQVVVIFMTSLFTMATVQPVKNTLYICFKCLLPKNEPLSDPHFSVLNNDQHVKTKRFAKLYMHQSIPTVPIPPPPPRANPRALAFLYKKNWQIPRGGDEGTGQMPRSRVDCFQTLDR